MPVPSVITDLSATAASNSPAGGDAVFPDLDNYLRAHAGLIRYGDTKAANVASATNIDLGAAAGRVVDVTGTTTIASFGTVSEGVWRIVRFTGALTLTYNATSLILPGAANIATAAGDCAVAVSLGSGNWLVTHFQRAAGTVSFSVNGSGTGVGGSNSAFTNYSGTPYNVGAAMNSTTGVFTAPRAGYYSFSATFRGVSSGGVMATEVGFIVVGSAGMFQVGSLYAAATGVGVYENVASGPTYLTAGQQVTTYFLNSNNTSTLACESFVGAFIAHP
jgi:hypothetical protein